MPEFEFVIFVGDPAKVSREMTELWNNRGDWMIQVKKMEFAATDSYDMAVLIEKYRLVDVE